MRTLTVMMLISCCGAPRAFAQDGSRQGRFLNDVAVAIAAAEPARPSSNAVARATSLREATTREGVRLAQSGAPSPSSPPVTSRSWAARHPVKTGLLVGGAIGALVGAASCGSEGFYVALCGGTGFGIGGGTGALVGVAVSKR